MKNPKPKLLAIVGPTASGKSALGIAVAKAVGGEVVSADSRQLYKGMDIAAAIEPGKWVGRGVSRTYVVGVVPHHLMAIHAPDRPISLAEYQRMAFAAIDGIIARGKVPVLVGGTGLYVNAVVNNYRIPEVAPDPALRAELERLSTPRLFAMLRRKDPDYASRIPSGNRRYAIRALEVHAASGGRFSAIQEKGSPKYRVLLLTPKRGREELYRRIDKRVDAMAEQGIVAEAKRLTKRFGWDVAPMTALGYGQLRSAMEGKEPLKAGLDRLKRDTRRYAKRQLTWFRRDKRIRSAASAKEAIRLAKRFLRG
jgi:tRNA dimethylallyltransferase